MKQFTEGGVFVPGIRFKNFFIRLSTYLYVDYSFISAISIFIVGFNLLYESFTINRRVTESYREIVVYRTDGVERNW